jgi:lincosamide nucleotidyltransferase A/C/D/E
MTVPDVHRLLDLFDELAITVWIDGGWGVDALLGEQTRPHADLDIMIKTADATLLRQALLDRGFVDVPTGDHSGWNYVMGDAASRLIDFHLIDLTASGDGIYGPVENGDMVPAAALTATGSIGGRAVQCLTPEYQVNSHTGYKLADTDFADMNALHQRFGVELREEQKRRG